MKIVHALGWYFPDSVGGTEVYVAGLCRRLAALGHEVAIAAPHTGSREVREYRHEGVPVFRYPIAIRPTRDEAQALAPARGAERLGRFLDAVKPSIFHMHSVVTGLGRFELAAARACGARTVLTHHLPGLGHICRRGTLMEHGTTACDGVAAPARCAACVLEDRGLSARVAGRFAALPLAFSRAAGRLPGRVGTALGLAASIEHDRELDRDLNGSSDTIVVLNEAARRILVANGMTAGKLFVNRLGHSHSTLPAGRPAGTRQPVRFGFVGRLHPIKGAIELAKAASLVPSTAPFTLEIRGPVTSDIDRRVLDAVTSMASRDRRIRIAPAVRPDEVPAALASYDVLCCPSTSFENGPTVAIEAMAVGTPVLGSRVGNLAELVEDGVDGRLVPAGDARALADALEEIATRPSVVDAWRARLPPARTMDDVADDYLRLYSALTAAVPGPSFASAV